MRRPNPLNKRIEALEDIRVAQRIDAIIRAMSDEDLLTTYAIMKADCGQPLTPEEAARFDASGGVFPSSASTL